MNKPDKLDIESFGDYRIGLTLDEIKEYLAIRCQEHNLDIDAKKMYKRFSEIAGSNTMAVTRDGKVLMYRWDVKRFADKMFLNKETYFD